MLLPHDFSLVDNFCRVPVQKEISEIEAVSGRVKPALSKSREVPVERALRTSASSDTAVMSQQGNDRSSNSCSVRGKKQHGAVPHVWEQQPAGCQRSNSTLQHTEGCNGDRPSLLPYKRTEPAHPWNGAGHGGKQKASPEADASGLPLKRSHAERQQRSTKCDMAPKREIGAEPNGNIYVKVVQQVRSERACHQTAAEAPLRAGGLPRRAGPSTGEDLPLPCAPTPSPRPRLDVNARVWKKGDQQQRSCLPEREQGVRAQTACRLQQHSLGLPQHGAPSKEQEDSDEKRGPWN
ncbi:uncharacterized protein LOC116237737 isoform X2 [Phasianus colchicus]|uniref:uncharacterized protein LOC116237737 isoform X2 n=1 Tax=Phasianus colchicus TaxID=9054 RepID=UPI00129E9561|nr:uncharacterized protein LOC116237737 isoform X2 [Phasianus colchicus]